RPGLPWRFGIHQRRNRRDFGIRRHQNERGYGHPILLFPPGGRTYVQELRRSPENRRRSRQQEGLRPARLPQARGKGHGPAHQGSLRRSELDRQDPVLGLITRRRPGSPKGLTSGDIRSPYAYRQALAGRSRKRFFHRGLSYSPF